MQEFVFSVTAHDGTTTFVLVRASDVNKANALVLATYGDAGMQITYRGDASAFGQDQLGNMDVLGGTTQPVQPAGGALKPSGNYEVQPRFPFQAYLEGVRKAGYNPEGAFGGYLQDRGSAIGANFWANTALKQGRGEDTNNLDFQLYSQANTGGANPYAVARDRFRDIAGGAKVGGTGITGDALRNVRSGINYGEGATDPGAGDYRGQFTNLAKSAAFGQYGGWGTTLLPSDQRLKEQFEQDLYANESAAATQGAAGSKRPGLSYVDFLRHQYGLR